MAGVGGTLPVVLAAAQAVGATPAQASSWVSGLGIATAVSALFLSVRYRMPIITAWSTPGAALIASSPGVPGLRAAVGAFVLAAVLILLTAAIRPLARLIERIPRSIAAAMLGGILLRLVVAMIEQVPHQPLLVLSLIVLFLVVRHVVPTMASLVVLAAGALLAWTLGLVKPIPPLGVSASGLRDAGLGCGDPDRARRAALSRHHGVAEPAGLRGAARLGLSPADPAGAGGDRRCIARHGVRRRPYLEPGGDLGGALHRSRTRIPIRPSAGSPVCSTPCGGD